MKYLVAVPLLALAACAASPEKIEPVAISTNAYSGLSCSKVRAERVTTGQRLAALSLQQRETAELDAGGVFLLGLPLGSMGGGDKSEEIASLKGQINAMDARLAGC